MSGVRTQRSVMWCGILAAMCCLGQSSLPSLRVHAAGHVLEQADSQPFFWLGDTAWSLSKLTQDEILEYMADRREKEFTVIQVNCGFNEAWMQFRERPYLADDTDHPREEYWKHIDFIVRAAAESGLYVALVVMWGDAYAAAFQDDAAKAGRLGAWLGARYGEYSHVIWIVGGEYDAINRYDPNLTNAQRQVYAAMANGLKRGSHGKQLLTIHPGAARSSSIEFHDEPWLDFNMLQSGHVVDAHAWPCWGEIRPCLEVYELIERDYLRPSAKPVIDGEPIYETKPDGFYVGGSGERAGADVMRRKAYWSVLAGGLGFTYGHNDVEVFYVPGEETTNGQSRHWREGLAAEASSQLKHLRRLMEAYPSFERISDQSLIVRAPAIGPSEVRAARSAKGNWGLVYLPTGGSVTIRTDFLPRKGTAAWFDPRTGDSRLIGEVGNTGVMTFDAPGPIKSGNDWVLVIEASKPPDDSDSDGEHLSR